MPVSISERLRLTRAAFGAALALALCVGGIVTKAYAEDDEVEDTADTKFFKGFLKNLGLQDGTEKGIDYHERSPLVVPPTINLPPPESANTAVNNPAWPKDNDMKQRSAAVKRKKSPARQGSQVEEDSMRQLTAAEMAPVPVNQRGRPDGPPAENTAVGARPEQLTPSQLGSSGNPFGSFFGGRDGKEVKFVKEPERSALTDPPIGLRTPSSRYSYGTKGKLDPTKEVGSDQAVFGVDK